MWVEFTAPMSRRVLRDSARTAFYYFPGEVLDLPPEWAREHIDAGEAKPAPNPGANAPAEAWLPPTLGDAIRLCESKCSQGQLSKARGRCQVTAYGRWNSP